MKYLMDLIQAAVVVAGWFGMTWLNGRLDRHYGDDTRVRIAWSIGICAVLTVACVLLQLWWVAVITLVLTAFWSVCYAGKGESK